MNDFPTVRSSHLDSRRLVRFRVFAAEDWSNGEPSYSQGTRLSTSRSVVVAKGPATHLDVTDLPCLVPALGPIAPAFGLGTIGRTGTITTDAVVVRFLNMVLRDRKQTPSAARLTRGLAGVQDGRTQ